jgi:hypothetical protein
MLKSQIKTMLITFFDFKGTVHFEFILPYSQLNLLCGNTEAAMWIWVYKKASTLAKWLDSLHKNAPANKALTAKQFLDQKIDYSHPIPLIWLQMISGCFQK